MDYVGDIEVILYDMGVIALMIPVISSLKLYGNQDRAHLDYCVLKMKVLRY